MTSVESTTNSQENVKTNEIDVNSSGETIEEHSDESTSSSNMIVLRDSPVHHLDETEMAADDNETFTDYEVTENEVEILKNILDTLGLDVELEMNGKLNENEYDIDNDILSDNTTIDPDFKDCEEFNELFNF